MPLLVDEAMGPRALRLEAGDGVADNRRAVCVVRH
jgi:hypothetical protein